MIRRGRFAAIFVLLATLSLPAIPLVRASSCSAIPGAPIPAGGGNTVSTAAIIVTVSGSTVSGVDATGCDVGVYVGPGVSGVTVTGSVHDSNKVGILVNGGDATVTGAMVMNIGAHTGAAFTPNGVQTGIGVRFANGATGLVSGSTIMTYQKNGIVIRDSAVDSLGNTITGLGPVPFIGQNGIEYASGATGTVRGNTITGNFYTGLEGVLADGTPCGPSQGTVCPPGRLYVSTGLLLIFVSPGSVLRGQNDLSDNQLPAATIPSVPASP